MADFNNNYNGFASNHWNVDSRPLSEATSVLRTFVLQNIVQDNQWEIDRITRYYLFWKFYDGLHYKDFNDGLLSFNYVRAFIDKINMYLLGNEGFQFHVKSFYSAQIPSELEQTVEELMMYHWGKSGKLQLSYEMLQMGSITGDLFIGLSWNVEGNFCKISVFDSRQCFVEFNNGNYNDVKSFLVRQPLETKGNKNKYKMFVQKWTNDTVETWYQKDCVLGEEQVVKLEHKKYHNAYGFIPVVHIKNKPNSAGYYGKSDANDILKINKVYNELMQQLKAIIDYHVTPTTVVTGANVRNLKRGLGQIWSGLPPEAQVFNLGLDVDLSSSINYAKDLKTAMHELSDVPENALGKIQAISNTSAAALQITYHPLIQQANIKAMMYGDGIIRANNMILRIMAVEDPENERLKAIQKIFPNYLTELSIEPIFPFGFPKDKQSELQTAQIELQNKLASRREVMERMGKENIPALLQEIDEDAIHQAELEAILNGGAEEEEGEETPNEGGQNNNEA